jgi:hypothetical protein
MVRRANRFLVTETLWGYSIFHNSLVNKPLLYQHRKCRTEMDITNLR